MGEFIDFMIEGATQAENQSKCEGFCICAKAKATHYVQNLWWRNFKYFGVCDNCLKGYNEDIDHFKVLSKEEVIVLQVMEEECQEWP